MICIYHNDADGHCAAAIVSLMIAHDMEPKNFIEYAHTGQINLPDDDIHEKERVFIVDLALDYNIMKVIRRCLKKQCEIVHIDHHAGGKIFEERLSQGDRILYERVTNFYNEKISGCLLTLVYSYMTDKEKNNPSTVSYDFTEDFSHVAFYPENKKLMRECFVPTAVRYINDQDVWTHQFKESRYFNLGYTMEKNHPIDGHQFWVDMLYDNNIMEVQRLINNGETVNSYQEKIYKQANKNGFEAFINGFKGWVVNCPIGNSFLFGDKYMQYDFVCKYAFDGEINKWRYSFYSKNESKFDCGKVCRSTFNGNGHVHAASGFLDYNFFNRVGTVL